MVLFRFMRIKLFDQVEIKAFLYFINKARRASTTLYYSPYILHYSLTPPLHEMKTSQFYVI